MRHSVITTILVVFTCASVAFASETQRQSGDTTSAAINSSPHTAEQNEILQAAEAFASAFNQGDAKAVAAFWTPDCEFVDESGIVTKGRGGIEKEYVELFKLKPGITMDPSVSSVKIISPGVALEDGSTIFRNSKGKLISRAYYSAIQVKQDGKWLLARVREQASPQFEASVKLDDLEWLIGNWTTGDESKKVDLTFKWIMEKKFLEVSYTAKDGKGNTRSGLQIIGQDPSTGDLVSRSFFANGGFGQGRWKPFRNGWIIDSLGRMPDGTRTASTYLISRTDENTLALKSAGRRIEGKRLKDTEDFLLKRVNQ